MFEAIYQGILLGLALSCTFGPGFFALINTGIKYGFKSGAALAIGIFLSDLFLVILIFVLLSLGAQGILSNPKSQSFIGVVGGIILIVYGSFNLYSKPPKTDAQIDDPTGVNHLNIETDVQTKAEKKLIDKIAHTNEVLPSSFLLGLKGFFINLLNPFVWIFWMATSTTVGSKFEFSYVKIVIFFTFTLGVILAADLLKAFISNKIKRFLTPRLMKIVNIISGVILIGFGFYLIYKIYFQPQANG
ncbi:MAG: lysine exporter protein (lyse/ygga) [Bacteroidetes bacterium]|jgi:threonine/homoserine/homoserine lactone efflux protein|nr:lysine exporter protein (lyse/ygga) [Bacteroidota bacterium]